MSRFGSASAERRRPVPTGKGTASWWSFLPTCAAPNGTRWSRPWPAGWRLTVPTCTHPTPSSSSGPSASVGATSTVWRPPPSDGPPPRSSAGVRAHSTLARSASRRGCESSPNGYSTRSSSTSWPISSNRPTRPGSTSSSSAIRAGRGRHLPRGLCPRAAHARGRGRSVGRRVRSEGRGSRSAHHHLARHSRRWVVWLNRAAVGGGQTGPAPVPLTTGPYTVRGDRVPAWAPSGTTP